MTEQARRRRPSPWSEPTRAEWQARCNICGWALGHSNVCPYGPMPTGRRRDR